MGKTHGERVASVQLLFPLYCVMTITIHACFSAESIGTRFVRRGSGRIINLGLPYVYQATDVSSSIACCEQCAKDENCWSVNYNRLSTDCQLSTIPLAGVSFYETTLYGWNIYSKTEWYPFFRGFAGIGHDVYEPWLNGTNITTNDTCRRADCHQHYRSPFVNYWNNAFTISQVKFAFYTGSAEVAYITFNGTGSDKLNWFSQQRVLDTSWSGVKNVTCDFFSAQGQGPSRRFMIATYAGYCKGDLFAMAVFTSGAYTCTFDQYSSYPQFLYSTGSAWSQPHYGIGVGYADSIAILIKGE